MDETVDAPRRDGEMMGEPHEEPLRFFFIHLMKTAGTSFAFQLRRQFDPSEVYPSEGLDRRDGTDMAAYVSISRLLRLSPERRDAIRIYTGHYPYIASQLLGLDLVTLTILRNPVDRTISVLKHMKRLSRRYKTYPLEEIYEDPFVFAHFVENHQTRMFSITRADEPEAFGSGMSYWETAALLGFGPQREGVELEEIDRERAIAPAQASMVDGARLEVAKKQLATVDVIGFSEQYTEFIEELRHRYGWWPEGLNTTARANESSEGWDVPAALRKRIAADNAYDVELCEFAHELVRERRSRAAAPTSRATVAVPPSGAAVATSKDKAEPAAGHTATAAKPDAPKSELPRPAPQDLRAQIRARHPHFIEAVIADARITAAMRSERSEFRGRKDALLQAVRLAWVSDAFLAQALYRAKARMQALGVPVLPRIAHRLAMMTAQICIGDPVVMRPGVYIAHGQVVIDGFVEIHRGVVIFPWVTIGLRAGNFRGPTIGRNAKIGTGAKIIGPVTVHKGASIGANAVVVNDVPANTSVVGVKARPTGGKPKR
ncbi:MAG: serine O-acetyltransferase [Actinomycetota bacterium]|nr:serine O-acetyltransferase [Actinomycetota bacterium]